MKIRRKNHRSISFQVKTMEEAHKNYFTLQAGMRGLRLKMTMDAVENEDGGFDVTITWWKESIF